MIRKGLLDAQWHEDMALWENSQNHVKDILKLNTLRGIVETWRRRRHDWSPIFTPEQRHFLELHLSPHRETLLKAYQIKHGTKKWVG